MCRPRLSRHSLRQRFGLAFVRRRRSWRGPKALQVGPNRPRCGARPNHQQAEKDAADRAAVLAALERQLKRGDKALVGNTGYRRFLKTVGDGHFAIDRNKADEDARFDGVFVLRTNTDLNPLVTMLRYKQLWTVEQTFRTAKHLLAKGALAISASLNRWRRP